MAPLSKIANFILISKHTSQRSRIIVSPFSYTTIANACYFNFILRYTTNRYKHQKCEKLIFELFSSYDFVF